MLKGTVFWGVLALSFAAGLAFALAGCGIDSGSGGDRPAYGMPGSGGYGDGSSNPDGTSGGGGSTPGGSSGGSGSGDDSDSTGGGSGSGLEQQLFDLINEGRERNGRTALQWDSGIANVARDYCVWLANWIAGKGSSTPYAPNHDGKSPSQRLKEGGVTFNSCAETGVLGDPVYLPPDVSTAEKAYANLDHSKLNSSAYTRAGVGHHFAHFGG